MILLDKEPWPLCTFRGVKQCRIYSLGYPATEVEILFFFFFCLLALTGIKKVLKSQNEVCSLALNDALLQK